MVQAIDTSYVSIAELAALYRQRDVSPVEVTQHLLERAAGLQERLHAYITLTPELALAEAEQTDTKIRTTQGERLITRRFGDLDRLFPADDALSKRSELGKAPVKPGTREDGRPTGLAEALVEPRACEGLDDLLVVVDRLPIVAQGKVGEAQKEGRHDLQRIFPLGNEATH
jgi:hypothetical protein